MKILLVDPDFQQRGKLEDTLKNWGFEPCSGETLGFGLELFLREAPSFVVVSSDFPEEELIRFCRVIREFPGVTYTYVIVSPSPDKESEIIRALEAGADDILTKPLNLVEARAKLKAGQRILDLEGQLKGRIQKLEESNTLIKKANERMKRDIYAVAKIQSSLLPSALPTVPEIEFAWVYRPRDELAGDCLNVFRLDENHLAFYVLDVSGSGTAAALLSVSLSRQLSPFPSQSTLLKQLLSGPPGYKISSPGEVLSSLNQSFPLDEQSQQYFTIFYGILDLKTLVLSYSLAGHPRPYLVSKTGARMVEGGGTPIGFVENAEFEEFSVQMALNDRLIVYSDGISESKNSVDQFFGKKAFSESIEKTKTRSLKDMLDAVLHDAEKWGGKPGMHDDVSLLCLEILKQRMG